MQKLYAVCIVAKQGMFGRTHEITDPFPVDAIDEIPDSLPKNAIGISFASRTEMIHEGELLVGEYQPIVKKYLFGRVITLDELRSMPEHEMTLENIEKKGKLEANIILTIDNHVFEYDPEVDVALEPPQHVLDNLELKYSGAESSKAQLETLLERLGAGSGKLKK